MESSDRRKLNGRKSRTFFCLSGKTQTSMTSVEKRVLEVKNTDYYSVNTFKYVYFFGEEVMYDAPVPKNSVLYSMHTSLEEKQKSIPAWSSDRLLELIPAYCGIDKEKTEYVASYVCSHEVLKWSANNPLEAIYNMAVWLLEYNYIKK